jgi:hypothetical protein
MQYNDLSIHQKITIKGWIAQPSSRPPFKSETMNELLDGLHALWHIDGYVAAVNMFLYKMGL